MRWERAAVMVVAVVAAACAVTAPPSTGPQMPTELWQGRATFMLQPVEDGVAEAEIAAALRPMLAAAPICARAPGLWLDGPPRSSAIVVRFDLMQRDWGADVAEDARQRMNTLVEMGFLTVTEEAGVATFAMTEFGRASIRGSFAGGPTPSFCAPSEQRLVRIVSMERGAFPCGSLRVRFAHVNDQLPAWARSAAAQRAVTDAGFSPGLTGEGTVTLSRRWYSRETLPRGFVNGSLGSLCRDERRDMYQGDDLTFLGASQAAPSVPQIEETPLSP